MTALGDPGAAPTEALGVTLTEAYGGENSGVPYTGGTETTISTGRHASGPTTLSTPLGTVVGSVIGSVAGTSALVVVMYLCIVKRSAHRLKWPGSGGALTGDGVSGFICLL